MDVSFAVFEILTYLSQKYLVFLPFDLTVVQVIQGYRSLCQSKAHM